MNSVGSDQTIAIQERLGERELYAKLELLLRDQVDMAVPSNRRNIGSQA
jgi:hypothetical protein